MRKRRRSVGGFDVGGWRVAVVSCPGSCASRLARPTAARGVRVLMRRAGQAVWVLVYGMFGGRCGWLSARSASPPAAGSALALAVMQTRRADGRLDWVGVQCSGFLSCTISQTGVPRRNLGDSARQSCTGAQIGCDRAIWDLKHVAGGLGGLRARARRRPRLRPRRAEGPCSRSAQRTRSRSWPRRGEDAIQSHPGTAR
jgi:hypothetical protein